MDLQVLPQEALASLAKAMGGATFSELDTNGDGVIDQGEFRRGLQVAYDAQAPLGRSGRHDSRGR